jgi:5-carboxymethyl-2-hydroxymuconic-semialdehyde dehydrogenase
VLRVTPFDSDEEAISLARAISDAPAAYLWTSDLQRAHRLALALASAHTWVNSRNPQDHQAPSADSGPDGSDAIDFYTQYQAVHIGGDVPRAAARHQLDGRDGRLAGNPRSR